MNLVFFVVRRLVVLGVLLVVISFGVFALLYAAPGSPEQALLGTRAASDETLQAIRDRYGLDEPFMIQYATWLGNAVQLDFGTSLRTGRPVLTSITERYELTAFLGIYAFIIATGIGVPLGVAAALRSQGAIDRAIVALSVIGVSAPAFATGIFLLYVFAALLGWFPAFGPGDGFADRMWHLTLPAVALALTAAALVVKLTRAAMVNTLEQDYITFARARGVPRWRVLLMYAFRNALIPVVTATGLILGYMLTGAVLVEVTFALPGMGSLLVDAVTFKDVPTVQGIAMIVAIAVVLVNLVTDILYLLIDPRIRLGAAAI